MVHLLADVHVGPGYAGLGPPAPAAASAQLRLQHRLQLQLRFDPLPPSPAPPGGTALFRKRPRSRPPSAPPASPSATAASEADERWRRGFEVRKDLLDLQAPDPTTDDLELDDRDQFAER